MRDSNRERSNAPKPAQEQQVDRLPGAGPHSIPELPDPEKTPGSGMLPEPDDPNVSPTG